MIISGYEFQNDEGEELIKEVEQFILDKLNVKTTVRNVTKVRDGMYIIRVDTFAHKIEIMRNRSYLNYISGRSVQVYSDYTHQENVIQNIIQSKAEQERRKGNFVRTGYLKIHINNETLVWNEERQQLMKVTVFPVSEDISN